MDFLRRFVLFFLVSQLISFGIKAQSVTYSDYDRYDLRDGEYEVIGMCGGRFYAYRKMDDSCLLEAFDDAMNKKATVVLDFLPDKLYEIHFVAYPEKILVLFQALESNKVVQYAALLDGLGRLKSKPVMLGFKKTGIFGAVKTYFEHCVSDNKRLILAYSSEAKGSTFELEGKIIDDNLNILKHVHSTFSTDNSLEAGEKSIANDTTIYVQTYTTTGTLNYADQYWILKLKPSTSKFEHLELKLGDKYATGGYMKIDNMNNRLYFGGFYSDKKNGDFDGVIYAQYDNSSHSFQTTKFIPFDEKLKLASGIRQSEHPFDNYHVKQIIIKNDGGFVMVSEIQYTTTRSNYYPSPGYYAFYNSVSTSIVREYHFKDIMALSYDKDGNRLWSSFVPKEQYSQEDGGMFSSYSFLNSGGTLAFMYNDFNQYHSRIQLATVYPDGKTSSHSFVPDNNNDVPDWLPKSGKQVAGRVLIIPCLRKKQICFARIEF